jgi:radical SAM superfamily enzyme YgiQ (UPF0313 family)
VADILFIYNDRSAHTHYTFGLGIASIASHLKKHGLTAELLYCKTQADADTAVQRVRDARPVVVGFYGPSSGFPAVLEMSAAIRRAYPDLFQVYGGPQATVEADCLERAPDLDAVCVGYGEEPLLQLVRRLRSGEDVSDVPGLWIAARGDGHRILHRNPPWDWGDDADLYLGYDFGLFLRELESRPDFSLDGRYLEIMFCRGCVYDCSFCSNLAIRRVIGKRLFRPSPAVCIQVVKQAIEETGLRRVVFHDDILTSDRRWFHELMTRYQAEVGLPFNCNLRAGCFRDDDVRALKAAGVERVFIGVESGNEAIRGIVLHKGTSRDDLLEGLRLLHKHGVAVVTQNLIGLPGETPRAFLDTVRLNATLDPSGMILSIYYPYPGTELERVCREQGLLSKHPPAGMLERNDTVLELPSFPRRRILFYSKHFAQFCTYERRRRRHPGLFAVPLTPVTAPALGLALDAYFLAKSLRRRRAL